MEKTESAHSYMGQKVNICTKGIWGHRANRYECVVSGLSGRYPERKIRLTVVGQGSVLPDSFNDFVLDKSEFYKGAENPLLFVDYIESVETQRQDLNSNDK